MARKYNLLPIKTIKDWEGEDWDVYEEKRLLNGLTLFRGRMHERVYGHNAIILTQELAEFIKQNHSIKLPVLAKQLGFSKDVLIRFRKRLDIQKKVPKPDYEWVIAHQDEILYATHHVLFEKYQLDTGRVSRYTRYLIEKVGITPIRKRDKRKVLAEIDEKILTHQELILSCNKIDDLVEAMDICIPVAARIHKQMCKEQNLSTTAERLKQKRAEKKQWLLENQHALLSNELPVKDVAQKFNLTKHQLMSARAQLKKLLNISKRPLAIDWVKSHQYELMHLNNEELLHKYQLSRKQIYFRRSLLRDLQQNEVQTVV
ncbi:hypothetical protein ACG91D_06135 [Acinetobacter guillouiae]|uniref:hypothetical protein n=1 Tax=Acinetobacter guillouiae TaxID=106649 RepID=UPI003AF84570